MRIKKRIRVRSHARKGTKGVREYAKEYYVDANDERTQPIQSGGELRGRYEPEYSPKKDTTFVIRSHETGRIVGRAKAFEVDTKTKRIKYPREADVVVGGRILPGVKVKK